MNCVNAQLPRSSRGPFSFLCCVWEYKTSGFWLFIILLIWGRYPRALPRCEPNYFATSILSKRVCIHTHASMHAHSCTSQITQGKLWRCCYVWHDHNMFTSGHHHISHDKHHPFSCALTTYIHLHTYAPSNTPGESNNLWSEFVWNTDVCPRFNISDIINR